MISVSGANRFNVGKKEFDDINKDMFVEDVKPFINLCPERICFYSKNDPYVSLAALQSFAEELNAKTYVYEKAGHFNEKAGYNTFEDLFKLLNV